MQKKELTFERTVGGRTYDQIQRWVCFVCIQLLLVSSVAAQDENIKWGEIPNEYLEMTEFATDSNASVVILSDVGEVQFNSDYEMEYTRHRRIKILSEAGYDWATVKVPFYAEGNFQRVSKGSIKGQTFVQAPDGSVQRTELDKKSIHEEARDDHWHQMRFTLPALVPGCVIEYKYTVISKHGAFLRDWQFQGDEPTLWSAFSAEIPAVYHYVMVSQGSTKLHQEDRQTYVWPPRRGQANELSCTRFLWAMRDIPALREEPFVTTLDDFRRKISFQLAKVHFPRSAPQPIMDTWERLAEDLLDDGMFGRQLEKHRVLRERTEELVGGLSTSAEKVSVLYNYVRTTMTWNRQYRAFCEQSLDKAFQSQQGNSAEINLMLTSMLRDAGLDARPVLISTRKNGKIITAYSIVSQFNHVLVLVAFGDELRLLDATDPLRPIDLLPVEALNETGWIVDKDSGGWVDISRFGNFVNKTLVTAELHHDGTIEGWFESLHEGYSALFDRQALLERSESEFIHDGWLSDFTGAELDSFEVVQRDSTEMGLMTKAYFSSGSYAQVADNMIYLNPIFFGRVDENPLKSPHRTFPVDFAYGRRMDYTLNLKIPEGYSVEDLPGRTVHRLAQKDGQITYLMQAQGNNLQLISRMEIRKTRFEPHEYTKLREFYDKKVECDAKLVVLKRETPESN